MSVLFIRGCTHSSLVCCGIVYMQLVLHMRVNLVAYFSGVSFMFALFRFACMVGCGISMRALLNE